MTPTNRSVWMRSSDRALTECIWSELDTKSKEICCSTIRRNLQREHLSRLANIAIGSNNRISSFDFIIFSSAGEITHLTLVVWRACT